MERFASFFILFSFRCFGVPVSLCAMCSMPWERTTMTEYLVELLLQLAGGMTYVVCIFQAVEVLMGFYFYLECFCIDLQKMYQEVDDCFVGDSDTKASYGIAQLRMISIVKFHINILR